MKPTSGTLSVRGRLSALIEIGAGFHPDLTGRENVFLYGTILGMKREEIRRKFDAIVEFSGLSEFIDTPVKRYSSGMYARLGFSVSATSSPTCCWSTRC
jgi:lipopolysaccharide transport system ATP-binding protein